MFQQPILAFYVTTLLTEMETRPQGEIARPPTHSVSAVAGNSLDHAYLAEILLVCYPIPPLWQLNPDRDIG